MMDLNRFGLAARYYEKAYEIAPNPRYLLLAAEAWAMNREPRPAAAAVARARATGRLNAFSQDAAAKLEEMIHAMEADTAAAR